MASPANGSVSVFGTTAAYGCDVGYTLVSVSARTCLADGTWSGSAPICTVQ